MLRDKTHPLHRMDPVILERGVASPSAPVPKLSHPETGADHTAWAGPHRKLFPPWPLWFCSTLEDSWVDDANSRLSDVEIPRGNLQLRRKEHVVREGVCRGTQVKSGHSSPSTGKNHEPGWGKGTQGGKP